MKKNNILIIMFLIIITLIIAIIFSYVWISKNERQNKQIEVRKQQQVQIQKFKGTPKDFLNKKETLKCSFSSLENGAPMNGVAYLDDGNLFQDINIQQKNNRTKVNILLINNDMYTWNPEGDKVAILADITESDMSNSVINMLFQYKCSPWKVDESKFDIPKHFINVNDLNNQNNIISTSTPDAEFSQNINKNNSEPLWTDCASCDQSNHPEQCRIGLSCDAMEGDNNIKVISDPDEILNK